MTSGDSTGVDRITGNTTSVAVKAPCVVAAVSPITLSGTQTIDGVALSTGGSTPTGTAPPDRVLVMGQTDETTNGIYLVQTGAWIRAYDFDGTRDAVTGTLVFVRNGTTYANTWWRVTTTDNPIEFGVSNITFSQVNDLGTPAGTTGQLQYNSSGAFGAVTSGATVSSTGSLTYTNSIASSQFPSVGANTVLANASSAVGTVAATSIAAGTLLGRGTTGNIQGISSGYGIAIGTSMLNLSQNYLTNSISSDIQLASSANYYDGPTVALSSLGGTWLVSASITLAALGSSAAIIDGKLWDGTTVIDSGVCVVTGSQYGNISLSGIISAPAGNVKVSTKAPGVVGPAVSMSANASANAKDCTITAVRIA